MPTDERPGAASWLVLPLAEVRGWFQSWKLILLWLVCCGPQLYIIFKLFMAFSFSGSEMVGRRTREFAASLLGRSTEMEFYAESLVQLPITLIFTAVFVAATSIHTVSRDRRFGALELYFTRPLRTGHYIGGRWLGASFSVAMVTALPVILAWLVAALTAPDWGFLVETIHIPLRLALQGLFFCGLMGLCITAISSLSGNSRTCQVTWIGFTLIMHMVFSTGLRRLIQREWPVQFSPWGIMQRVSEAILGVAPEHPSLVLAGKWITGPIDWLRNDLFGMETRLGRADDPMLGCLEPCLLLALAAFLVLKRTIKPVEVVG